MTGKRSSSLCVGLLILLFLSVLVGCREAIEEGAGDQEKDPMVTGSQPVPTQSPVEEQAMPTTVPSPSPVTIPTAVQTSVPTLTPAETIEAITTTATPQGANADVEFVRAVQKEDGSWTFHVTVRHPDTGWQDYADGWDVVTADGHVVKRDEADLFTRLLLHPHENEQPFTRSQGGLFLPEGVSQITVRAHDLVDGYGGRQILVDLNISSGPDFQVERR